MPKLTKYDLKEACICIALERPTAAAFHILRGTEEVLKKYHKKYFPSKNTFLAWGPMTQQIKNYSGTKKIDMTLLGNLDHIRMNFRNPTQHPDKIYEIQEVQSLLSLCIDVTSRMS